MDPYRGLTRPPFPADLLTVLAVIEKWLRTIPEECPLCRRAVWDLADHAGDCELARIIREAGH